MKIFEVKSCQLCSINCKHPKKQNVVCTKATVEATFYCLARSCCHCGAPHRIARYARPDARSCAQ
jgi:hypothetical protein